ncbi:MAG: metallophosphoesterase [Acidiferrobacterales bacterium]|nr:metallophosphoesterase [Acidiferrobacterales bacterium]
MKLHILNDLHVEFEDFNVPETDADAVILAGDIGVGFGGLEWASRCITDKPVIYIPGNHEFYGHDIRLVDQLKESAAEHVHVLDNDEMTINGVRFLGCTLWTDFKINGAAGEVQAILAARSRMSDFSRISMDGERFDPNDSVVLHETSRAWLSDRLAEHSPGATVVITHHAPSSKSRHPRFESDPLNPAFLSDLEPLMGGDRVQLWLHGHMHDSFDYDVDGTRVVCNPRGYSPFALNADFRSDLIIEV